MMFNILRASIVYGGGPGAPEYKVIEENVSSDYVQGFFKNIRIEKSSSGFFNTKEDSMGCYETYKIVVVSL